MEFGPKPSFKNDQETKSEVSDLFGTETLAEKALKDLDYNQRLEESNTGVLKKMEDEV